MFQWNFAGIRTKFTGTESFISDLEANIKPLWVRRNVLKWKPDRFKQEIKHRF